MLWELILEVFQPVKSGRTRPAKSGPSGPASTSYPPVFRELFGDIDYVPCTVPMSTGRGRCVIFEDNDAVIKACIKGRSPAMRHVARTHRVDLDWLWERIRDDPGVFIKYVGTKEQIADLFTKGSFSGELWLRLCRLAQIGDEKSLAGRK